MGLALLTGCGDDSSSVFDSTSASVSSVAVDPQYFVGDVPCVGSDGAMKSYVATLTDRSIADSPFVLPSSPPTSCSDRIVFRYVVVGHVYSAEIDAYEEAPEALVPFGNEPMKDAEGNPIRRPPSGSRQMLLAKGGDVVTPRWTTACGEGLEGAGIAGISGEIRGCDPLEDRVGIGSATVAVDPRLALGALTCGSDPGQVMRFDVVPETPGLVPYINIPCGAVAPFVYEAGIEPGRTYTFQIVAAEAEDAAMNVKLYGARCYATAEPGLRITASCTPLSSAGALAIPLGSLLPDSEAGCEARVDLLAGGVVLSTIGPVSCDETVQAAHLAPGMYQANVVANLPEKTLSCTGEVQPGETTACQAGP